MPAPGVGGFWNTFGGNLRARGVIQFGSNVINMDGAGFPASGTAGDGAGKAGPGSTYFDRTRGTKWINTGTKASPYWTPSGPTQPGMWGVNTDFRETQTTALSDTSAKLINAAAGYRIYGAGTAVSDGGALQGTMIEGGTPLRLTASATNPGVVAIGMPEISGAGPYQPDTHGMAVVEAYVAHSAAITLRGGGIGFIGLAADGLVPPITCATTVATLVQDDLALLHFNVGYTATTQWKLASNKSDEAATMTAQAASPTAVVPAAGTWQLIRVEMEPIGTRVEMRAFVDKVLVGTISDALDEDEEANPVLYLESTSAVIKIMDCSRYMFVTGVASGAA